MNTCIRIFILLLFAGNSGLVLARDPLSQEAKQVNNQQSLAFIENKGQITDQYYHPRPDVDYKLSAGGVVLFIGDGQLHYQWSKTDPIDPGVAKRFDDPEAFDKQLQRHKTDIYRMDVILVGANKKAKVIAEGKQDYYEQYYTVGCENGATAYAYQRITYKNVYPDIDWVLYVKDNQLKYDFVVRPGGKVDNIRLKYEGATGLNIEDGALTASTPMGSITEQAPYSYIAGSKQPVVSSYQLEGNQLSFDIAPYSGTLVIDPQLGWATYYGGGDADATVGVSNDPVGNVYIVGTTLNSSNLATVGAHQVMYGGSITDAFLVKFNELGARQWATYYGGANLEYAGGVACDANGMIYITGQSSSQSGIATPGSFQPSHSVLGAVKYDAFLAKFNSAGVRQWATYFGDTAADYGSKVVADNFGNVYMAGVTKSIVNIATPGAQQVTPGGEVDIFLTKFNSTGTRLWATYCGGLQNENNVSIVCDNSGNVYLFGHTDSSTTGIATAGSFQPAFNGGNGDYFLVKFNSNGARQWGTYFGGSGQEYYQGGFGIKPNIAYDPAGYVYVAGGTNSLSGIATPGAYKSTFSGGSSFDAVLAKFSMAGNIQWSTYYGGLAEDIGFDVTVASSGIVFLTGKTYSSAGIATAGSYQTAYGGDADMFLAEFSPTGSLTEGTYYGGVNSDRSYSISHDNHDNIYIAGDTWGSGLATAGAFQTVNAGMYDAMLVKWLSDTSLFIQQPFVDTVLCRSQSVQVSYGVNYNFNPGNSFTVQLSNAAGSFAAPTNIGTALATGPGIINCIIPLSVPDGNGYRIRIVSSNPARISADNGINIRISTVPVVSASSNSPVCVNNPLNLTATSSVTSGVTYSWTGPSFSSSLQNPTISNAPVSASGTYTVTVNNNGCSGQASINVVVSTGVANPAATSNSPVCTGGSLQLNASTTSPGATYSWSGPGSFSSTAQNPTITGVTAADAGTYTVLMSSSQGCQSTMNITVLVNTVPATPTAGSNSPVCSSHAINLNASGPAGTTYQWTGPGGYNSNLQNPTRTNATLGMGGTYNVTATLNGCSSAPASTNVVVNATPTAPVATSNGPLCAGATLNLSATGLTGATYQWNGPAGYNSNAQNPTLLGTTTANAGIYTVTRTVNGCTSAPGTTNVVINNSVNPAIAVFPSPNDTICPGQVVVFVASSNNGGTAQQYQWKKNSNNIAGATAANYNTSAINSGDFFSCEMISSAACAFPQTVQSNNVLMTVEPPQPCAVSITANPGLVLSPWELVTFTATPVKGGLLPTYQWLRNGKPVIGAVSATWGANNLSSNDTISVVLFSTDPCAVPNTDTSNYLVVNIKTGINSINGVEGLTLYPNPNNGSFTIRGNINTKEADIEIVNALGQQVYTEKLVSTSSWLDHKIHLNAASGVYLLKVRTDEGTQIIRFQLKN